MTAYDGGGGGIYRCGAAARWLPRTLAAVVIGSAFLASSRVDPAHGATAASMLRALVVALGAAAALWIVRRGAELGVAVHVEEDGLAFVRGARRAELRLADVRSIFYHAPFAASRTWLPAAVLVDRFGQSWRLSPLLEDGDALIAEIVRRSGRSDLEAWVEALRLRPRMAGARRRVAVGYVAAGAILIAAALFAALRPG